MGQGAEGEEDEEGREIWISRGRRDGGHLGLDLRAV